MAGHTVEELQARMEEERIPCGRLLQADKVSKDPQVKARWQTRGEYYPQSFSFFSVSLLGLSTIN